MRNQATASNAPEVSPDEAPNSLRATSQTYGKKKLANPAMVRKNFTEPAIFINDEIEGNGQVNSIAISTNEQNY